MVDNMEKLNEKAEACDVCNEDLGRLFLLCKTCNKYLCYDCYYDHPIEHDPLPCKTLNRNKYVVMEPGEAGYGPKIEDTWPSLEIDAFFSSYHPKCQHAIDYFKEKNIIFFCHDCHEWVCFDCLDDHLDHGLMLNVGFDNGKQLRQIDPNLYDSEYKILISSKISKIDDQKIKVKLDINNPNDVPLYDLRLMCTWNGLNSSNAMDFETIENEDYNCIEITKLEVLPAHFNIKPIYDLDISNLGNSDFVINIIRFKDPLLGNGVGLTKSSI